MLTYDVNNTDKNPTVKPPYESSNGPLPEALILGYEDNLTSIYSVFEKPIKCISKKTDKHLLSIAPTRSGKGRSLILPNLLHWPQHSVLVVDPKGENALVTARYRRKLGHEVVIFNPYGLHQEAFAEIGCAQFASFNPIGSLELDAETLHDDIAIIAESLIYDTGGDAHWTESARGLIEFLILYLLHEPTETDKSVRRLRALIAGGQQGLRQERVCTPEEATADSRRFRFDDSRNAHVELSVYAKASASESELVRNMVDRYAAATEEVSSVFATAEAQTRILKSDVICAALDGDSFDFARMKQQPITMYLILPTERLITQARYLRLVLLVAMSHFLRSGMGACKVLMLLDEFANLGPLQIIEQGYGLIAGHGVTLWSFVQNLSQLKNLYPSSWETFIANSAVVTVSNVNDVTTVEYFKQRAGMHRVEQKSITEHTPQSNGSWSVPQTNKSVTISPTLEYALPEWTLYTAPYDTLFLFIEGLAQPKVIRKYFYDQDEPFYQRADPNPMVKAEESATVPCPRIHRHPEHHPESNLYSYTVDDQPKPIVCYKVARGYHRIDLNRYPQVRQHATDIQVPTPDRPDYATVYLTTKQLDLLGVICPECSHLRP